MTVLCVNIVKNKAIDIIRAMKHLSEEEIENLVVSDEHRELQPHHYLKQIEEQKHIRSIMEKLPEILKIIVTIQ